MTPSVTRVIDDAIHCVRRHDFAASNGAHDRLADRFSGLHVRKYAVLLIRPTSL